jgi:hypothetical protein
MEKETLEEAAERLYPNGCDGTDRSAEIYRRILIEGAKLQAERMYSEEEVLDITKQAYSMGRSNYTIKAFNEWFEQFKK